MFQRILVPLDGSERARLALPIAARIARASRGSLVLLRVVLPPLMNTCYPPESIGMIQEEISQGINQVVDDLKTVAHAQELEDIEVMTDVASGPVAEQILEGTAAHRCDLIVMSSHGYTGLKRWALGSVAQKIALYSTVPVLVVQESAASSLYQQSVAGQTVRIMVALDGSSLSEATLVPSAYLSTALSAPAQGALHLVRILHIPSSFEYGQEDNVAKARREGIKEARAYFDTLEFSLREGELVELNLQITSAITNDLDIAKKLIEVAERSGYSSAAIRCDVLALATHGRSGLARWTAGSITERILGSTTLPLLIVRPQQVQIGG